MNLIFYSPQSLPSIGGLQYVVHYWAEALSARGHKITIITDTPSPEDGAAPSPLRGRAGEGVVSAPSHGMAEGPSHPHAGGPGWARRASFFRQVRAMRAADKVIMFNASLKGLPAVLLSGKPLYISHHTALWYQNGKRPWRQRLKQWVANHLAKDNCACSAYIASLYTNCRTIHSPYRSDVFVPGSNERKPGSILFAGRLVSDKGADLLIKACGLLKKEGLTFSLTLVGDGPDREKILALAESLELGIESKKMSPSENHNFTTSPSENVPLKEVDSPPSGGSWRGALSQPALAHLMQTHQVMVVPSRMEPMGMVVAEGLACGCRMVVSNQGGMPEVGGPFCRYFESENVESLANAIREQLSNPLPVPAESLNRHLEKFSIEYSAGELEKWLME